MGRVINIGSVPEMGGVPEIGNTNWPAWPGQNVLHNMFNWGLGIRCRICTVARRAYHASFVSTIWCTRNSGKK
ncbi:hypothetical protein DCAR_0934465 [Daucus carota subsp. sativus]|uniref:Uncharacterized protein n=1 Tax=Daucus carota subsp. sativus TaxID=79200 RepID=A0A175YFY5_DAUCS|nr:hypothetical protein DCAR_0934465 [Daucus carota subsp. sativus]